MVIAVYLLLFDRCIVTNAKARIVAVYKLKYLAFLIFSNELQLTYKLTGALFLINKGVKYIFI